MSTRIGPTRNSSEIVVRSPVNFRRPESIKREHRGNRGMPGEWNLFGRSEIARAEVGHIRSDDERRFGQVHLARNGEPRLVAQIVGVEDDGARDYRREAWW